MQSIIAIELYTLLNALYAFGWKAILAILIAIAAVIFACFLYKAIKREQKEHEKEAINAISDFYAVTADLKQHLKDDGFTEPKPGSEEHFQRWKAENHK